MAVNAAQDQAIGANSDAITVMQGQLALTGPELADINSTLASQQAMLSDHDLRIDALESLTFDLADDVLRLGDEVRGSTAVAIAMGGATIFPDRPATLTANIGTYGGAVAGALQLNALVKPNVALNAGLATGFNKRGKVGARVGVSIGL